VCALTLVAAVPARASHVQCGDVITQDTTLDSDLVDCPGDGVVIGADNITLDLNGHTIDGVESQSEPTSGVDTEGHDRVTVENGSIKQFTLGVAVRHTDDSEVTGIRTTEVFSGVRLQYAKRNHVLRNDLSGYSIGVEVADDAQANLIERNVLAHSGNGIVLWRLDIPQHTEVPPVSNRIVRNDISKNAYGIFVWFSHFNLIERNSIDSNSEYGIYVTFVSSENSLRDNDLAGNGGGIAVFGQATDTAITGNRIARSHEDGLEVTTSGSGTTVIQGNASSANGEDGIDVDTANAAITKNTANGNGDLGIEAVPGVTDGGGNKARGNGNPAQCVNVSCK
jgi:parallel beta-helix repeat protein